jgi:uncharacterized membrane protein YgdD (TMEM256/DUF423 family)
MTPPRADPFVRVVVVGAGVIGALAVAAGAFGAHALRTRLDPAALATWRTAVDYQFWHALALLGLAAFARRTDASPPDLAFGAMHIAVVAFVLGIVLFCGSLYALALGAPHAFGIVTPVGGIALIAGWLALAAGAWRRP